MSAEKPYQPSEAEIAKAEEAMSWEQERQSYDRDVDLRAEKENATLSEFFTSRYSLHVYDEFRRDILPLAKEDDDSEIPNYTYFDTSVRANGLPRSYYDSKAFTLSQIRAFIKNQPKPDASGPLNTKLHVDNVFKVEEPDDNRIVKDEAVQVMSVGGVWSVDVWKYDRIPNPKGQRIFINEDK